MGTWPTTQVRGSNVACGVSHNSHTRDLHSVLTSGNQCDGTRGKGAWSLMDVFLNLSSTSIDLVTLGNFLSLTELQLSYL